MSFVIDSSIALASLLPDERVAEADGAMRRAFAEGAFVPALFRTEVANVLVVSLRRGRISPAFLSRALGRLARLELTVEPSDPHIDRLIDLAIRHRLSAYDAAYLEIASRKGAALATLDRPLRAAAEAEGVAIFSA